MAIIRILISQLIMIICVIPLLNSQREVKPINNPVELGAVTWLRNYDEAIKESKTKGLPIFILFQEVPGCATCTRYGRHVLSHPFMVETIEDRFIPLAIYNNKGGEDRRILEKFKEPAWNNPVVRIVNDRGIDLVPRLSGDFSRLGLADKIIAGLMQSGQTIPEYLIIWKKELAGEGHQKEAYLSMYCFWTGEKEIAKIPGILATEPGYMHQKEVVKVTYNSEETNLEKITKIAQSKNCADEVFADNMETINLPVRKTGRYRIDKDVKFYLSKSIYKSIPMTPLQAATVNSLIGEGMNPEIFLSPGQLALLRQNNNGSPGTGNNRSKAFYKVLLE